MSTQTTISQYFSNRKRHVDEIKSINQDNKLLTSDKNKIVSKDLSINDDTRLVLKRKISWDDDEIPRKKIITPSRHDPKRTPQFTTLRTNIKKSRVRSAEKSVVRKKLFEVIKKCSSEESQSDTEPRSLNQTKSSQEIKSTNIATAEEIKKESLNEQIVPDIGDIDRLSGDKEINRSPDDKEIKTPSVKDAVDPGLVISQNNAQSFSSPDALVRPVPSTSDNLREELGLGKLKAKLKGSSKLSKLKETLRRIDEGYRKLSETQDKLNDGPSLKKFDSIEIEVAASPVKSYKWDAPSPSKFSSPSKLREAVFRSPAKASTLVPSKLPYVSPKKLLEEMRPRDTSSYKTDYYARFSVIAAQEGKPCLPLPHSYRILAELFKSLEVVLSMMQSRKELAYFSKIKPSTQELCKKTFTERHVGQMLRIFPNAFRLSYEKVKVHGKPDKHELTIHPATPSNGEDRVQDGETVPSTVLERQRYFYKKLLNLVKGHHEKFLLELDPPLVVDKTKLTRWHPGFDVDSCPDIEPVEMPRPPHVETFTSARQLFGKAKELFMVNPRMEKALDKLPKTDNILTNGNPSAASAIPGLANALKGIPKSLLEKVRAKQAAKAVEMLTRDPQIAKQEIEVSRLPEMARILRYLFVVERKNVMTKSRILDKLSSSFRENLSASEMDRHLALLVEKTGTWLKVHKDHNVTFITMNKSMEMNDIYNAINRIQS